MFASRFGRALYRRTELHAYLLIQNGRTIHNAQIQYHGTVLYPLYLRYGLCSKNPKD